jgi:pantetheine-phosphate adenylyltransferase
MKPVYVFPGTFSPPTYGHLDIVLQAVESFPEVIIVCSVNSEKSKVMFTPDECKELWKTYDLPQSVKVFTFDEFQAMKIEPDRIVMIRGIRDREDMEHERKVMLLNKEEYGITKFYYIFSRDEYVKISSTKARQHAEEMDLVALSEEVSPLVITALLEQTIPTKNIFMVVGKPAGGKSTFLKMLERMDDNNVYINTDYFNQQLKSFLKERLGDNLLNVATNNEKLLKEIIAGPWIELLIKSLKEAPKKSNIFVEIPYGLQADKELYRLIGGKIIYIGCDDKEVAARNEQRNTPHLKEFINRIPDKEESARIVEQANLKAYYIDTNCSLEALTSVAQSFNEVIQGG